MIEDRLLTQAYTISNHPIREYDELIQCKYVKALGRRGGFPWTGHPINQR